jgi:hypothetical protein
VATSALLGYIAQALARRVPSANAGFIGSASAVFTLLSGLVFEPVRDALKSILKDFPHKRCHVMLFGAAGAGKTQIFRSLQNLPFRHGEETTTDFDIYPFPLRVGQGKAQTWIMSGGTGMTRPTALNSPKIPTK